MGWRIEHAESAAQFKELFIDAMEKHAVLRDQLTLHADCGGPMKAKTTALMLVDLGVLKSHTRPPRAPEGACRGRRQDEYEKADLLRKPARPQARGAGRAAAPPKAGGVGGRALA